MQPKVAGITMTIAAIVVGTIVAGLFLYDKVVNSLHCESTDCQSEFGWIKLPTILYKQCLGSQSVAITTAFPYGGKILRLNDRSLTEIAKTFELFSRDPRPGQYTIKSCPQLHVRFVEHHPTMCYFEESPLLLCNDIAHVAQLYQERKKNISVT